MRRAGAALVLLLGGCSAEDLVDTLLGLEATVAAADVAVAGDVVSVVLDVDYRNGTRTDGPRRFQPQALEVYTTDDAPVVQITPEIPSGFVVELAPGEAASVVLTGESRPGAATDPDRLCDGEATVLFRFVEGTTGEAGLVTTSAPVACD